MNIYEINSIIRPIIKKKNKNIFFNLDLEILKKKFVSVLY